MTGEMDRVIGVPSHARWIAAVLAGVMLLAVPASAQESRADAIAAEQARKAAVLKPYESTGKCGMRYSICRN